jgi:hypothetical protein
VWQVSSLWSLFRKDKGRETAKSSQDGAVEMIIIDLSVNKIHFFGGR